MIERIGNDRDSQQLRSLLLEGARSAPGVRADAAWFEVLRARAR